MCFRRPFHGSTRPKRGGSYVGHSDTDRNIISAVNCLYVYCECLNSAYVSARLSPLNAPISAVEGYVTLLQDTTCTEEEKQQYIDKILFNTKRLSELVGNILLLSKLESQAIETSKKLESSLSASVLGMVSPFSQRETAWRVT